MGRATYTPVTAGGSAWNIELRGYEALRHGSNNPLRYETRAEAAEACRGHIPPWTPVVTDADRALYAAIPAIRKLLEAFTPHVAAASFDVTADMSTLIRANALLEAFARQLDMREIQFSEADEILRDAVAFKIASHGADETAQIITDNPGSPLERAAKYLEGK